MPFAFGGEAEPVDYARAIADGAVLALIATLGLLQLGHETTPELVQLFGVSLFLYGRWRRRLTARGAPALAALAALPLLAGSGAPIVALAIGPGRLRGLRAIRAYAAGASPCALGRRLGTAGGGAAGAGRWAPGAGASHAHRARATCCSIGRLWLWFMWPAWPLALWTLWRWRRHL